MMHLYRAMLAAAAAAALASPYAAAQDTTASKQASTALPGAEDITSTAAPNTTFLLCNSSCALCCGSASPRPMSLVFRYVGGFQLVTSQRVPASIVIPPTPAAGVATIYVAGVPQTVQLGAEFVVSGAEGVFPARTEVVVDTSAGSQRISLRTDCNEPLAVGDVYGSVELVGFSRNVGPSGYPDPVTCPLSVLEVDRSPATVVADSTKPSGCKFDSMCVALAAQGRGKIQSVTFQLLDRTRLGDRDSHHQDGFAVIQPYRLPIVRHGSPDNTTTLEIGATDVDEVLELHDHDVFEVSGSLEGARAFPAHLTFLLGTGHVQATVTISTNCGRHDLRVGDVFGALKVVGYKLHLNMTEALSTDCQTEAVTTDAAGELGEESKTRIPTLAITAGMGVLLVLALIVTVHRLRRRRKRPTVDGGKHTVGNAVYTAEDKEAEDKESRLSDVSWNNGYGGHVDVTEVDEDALAIAEDKEVIIEDEEMVVGELIDELHRLDQKRRAQQQQVPRLSDRGPVSPRGRPRDRGPVSPRGASPHPWQPRGASPQPWHGRSTEA